MEAHTESPGRAGPSWGSVLGGAALIVSLVALGLVLVRFYDLPKPKPAPTPGEKVIQAPGPDNTVKTLPPQPEAPGPDNSVKSRPPTEPAVPPAARPESPRSSQPGGPQ